MNLLQENIIMKGIGQSLIQMSKPTIKEANKMLNEWELSIYKEKNEGATIEVQDKYGKNSILRGMDLEKGGTTIERNNQIGGHRR